MKWTTTEWTNTATSTNTTEKIKRMFLPVNFWGSWDMSRNQTRRRTTLIHLIDPDDEEKGGCLWVLLEGMATTAIIVMGVMMVYKYFYGG